MDQKVIILSGMPASGKDTITRELIKRDNRYVFFKKHRSILGWYDKRKRSYYDIERSEFEKKITEGFFMQYHQRYDRYYGISEKEFTKQLGLGKIPIIHIGRIENFRAFLGSINNYTKKYKKKIEVIHILLWETIEVLSERIIKREKSDEDICRRIEAIKQELSDIIGLINTDSYSYYHLIIKNSKIEDTCANILDFISSNDHPVTGFEELKKYLQEYKKGLKEENPTLVSLFTDNGNNKKDWSGKTLPCLISGRRIDGVVTFDNCITSDKNLKINNCNFDYLNIKQEDKSEIKEFVFETCKIEQVLFFKCNTNITFKDCYIEELHIEGNSNITKIELNKCRIKSFIMDKSMLNDVTLSYDTMIDKVDCRNSSIHVMDINSSHVGFLRINVIIGNLNVNNAGSLERFSIEEKDVLEAFLKSLKKRQNNLELTTHSLRLGEFQYQKLIILAGLCEYEAEHKYDEADLCLYYLRSIDCMIKKLQSKKWYRKILFLMDDYIIGNALGWGVKWLNIALSFIVVISLFAFINYWNMTEWRSCNSLSLAWENLRCLWDCTWLSIERFFNLNSPNSNLGSTMIIVDHIERVLGIIMQTIFMGVIFRKIIR